MSSDIRPLGTADGVGRYWIKVPPGLPGSAGSLRLVLIDEQGQVESTPLGMAWDDAAMTRDEAVEYHLRGAVAEADAYWSDDDGRRPSRRLSPSLRHWTSRPGGSSMTRQSLTT